MSEKIDGPYSPIALPPLPLEEWRDTKETLQRYVQIVGKIRLEYSPFRNHWWHVTLHVDPRGLSARHNRILNDRRPNFHDVVKICPPRS